MTDLIEAVEKKSVQLRVRDNPKKVRVLLSHADDLCTGILKPVGATIHGESAIKVYLILKPFAPPNFTFLVRVFNASPSVQVKHFYHFSLVFFGSLSTRADSRHPSDSCCISCTLVALGSLRSAVCGPDPAYVWILRGNQ